MRKLLISSIIGVSILSSGFSAYATTDINPADYIDASTSVSTTQAEENQFFKSIKKKYIKEKVKIFPAASMGKVINASSLPTAEVNEDGTIEMGTVGKSKSSTSTNTDVTISRVNPGVGATTIIQWSNAGKGTIVVDSKKSEKYGKIKDATMIIVGATVGKISGIVIDVVDFFGKDLIPEKQIKVHTHISYRYIGKEAKVWNGKTWSPHFESISRENFKHTTVAHVDKNNYTWEKTLNYTPASNPKYKPVKVDYAKHYKDDNYIHSQAYSNFKKNKYEVEQY